MSAGRRAAGDRGALAIVLHTHMPYVEGFGTWPFGEEWLWEAIAGCYLPLMDVLDAGAPITLSLTPVLADQLEVADIGRRFQSFVEDVRVETHERDTAGLREGGHERLADELERALGDYRDATRRLSERGGSLLGPLVRHARWTSAATHAVLPLLASDAGVRVQAHAGVLAHRERVGEHWDGGFWLPECAYAPWLGRTLHDAGVRRSCVELTSLYGLGAREHLQPLLTGDGIVLFPIDRSTISLVWSDDGYPAGGVYRDYHHHTIHHHNPWSNDGEAYDHDRAVAAAGAHARDFVARVRARLDDAAASGPALPGGGLVVCALDTELLGHWWYEGVDWLVAVVEECARQGVELVHVDEAPGASEPRATPAADSWMPSSWGEGGRLATWSGPAVAELAFATRAAELDVLGDSSVAGPAALRELLALQASDWAFMISRGIAAPYARERFDGHLARVREALAAGPDAPSTGLRNLARHAEHVSLSAL